jgi:hypothetical protein
MARSTCVHSGEASLGRIAATKSRLGCAVAKASGTGTHDQVS